MAENRFRVFNEEERNAISDGLLDEAELNPDEDPSFKVRVAVANALLDELEEKK